MVIICLPMLNSAGGFWEFERKNENRVFRDSLELLVSNLDVFPPQANEYVNDNFSFRSPLLDAYNFEKFYFFKISPYPEKTIIGSDGWFFMSQKEIKIYEGKEEFTEQQLVKFDSVWTYRKNYLDSLGISSYWVIGPMKHSIYEENVPYNKFKKSGDTRLETLTKHIGKKFPDLMINPTEEFLRAKDSLQLYYKLDNHWNRQAGFIVTNLILEKLQSNYPEVKLSQLSDYDWIDTTYLTGYHRDVIGVKSLIESDRFPVPKKEKSKPSYKYNFPVTEDFPYTNDFEKVHRNSSDTTLPKILVIRDSFGDQLVPFLKEPFSESVFIFDGWNYGLNKDIIETVKPDIVIFLGLETHLEHYIDR